MKIWYVLILVLCVLNKVSNDYTNESTYTEEADLSNYDEEVDESSYDEEADAQTAVETSPSSESQSAYEDYETVTDSETEPVSSTSDLIQHASDNVSVQTDDALNPLGGLTEEAEPNQHIPCTSKFLVPKYEPPENGGGDNDYYEYNQNGGADQLGDSNDDYQYDYEYQEPVYDNAESITPSKGEVYADYDLNDGYDLETPDSSQDTVPYLAVIHSPVNTCSGVIIQTEWILTAAQCVHDTHADQIQCYLDIKDLRSKPTIVARVKQTFIHPDYSGKEGLLNDIALVRLTEPLDFTLTINRLPLSDENNRAGNCILIGYGENVDLVVNINLEIQSGCECLKPEQFVCAPGVVLASQCIGDRGGPLVCTNELVGIFVGPYNNIYCKNEPGYEKISRRKYLKRNLRKLRKLKRIYYRSKRTSVSTDAVRKINHHERSSKDDYSEPDEYGDYTEDIPHSPASTDKGDGHNQEYSDYNHKDHDSTDKGDGHNQEYSDYNHKDHDSTDKGDGYNQEYSDYNHKDHETGSYDYNDENYDEKVHLTNATGDFCLEKNEYWVFVYARNYKDWLVQVTGHDDFEADAAAYFSDEMHLRSVAASSTALNSLTIATLLIAGIVKVSL